MRDINVPLLLRLHLLIGVQSSSRQVKRMRVVLSAGVRSIIVLHGSILNSTLSTHFTF